jgi:hypothetical protein
MQQYSPYNQRYLLSQMPDASDVRSFKAWSAAGRSVVKGAKALRVWVPKTRTTKTADEVTDAERSIYFRQCPVFDISQTRPTPPKKQGAGRVAAAVNAMDEAWDDYGKAIDAGDIPDSLDFADWYELREETRIARIMADVDATATRVIMAGTTTIAEYQQINA